MFAYQMKKKTLGCHQTWLENPRRNGGNWENHPWTLAMFQPEAYRPTIWTSAVLFPAPRSHGVCWPMAEQVGRSISSCCISCEKRAVRATFPCTFPARGGPWRALVAELWSKEGWMPSSWLVRWAVILFDLSIFIHSFICLLIYFHMHIHIYIYIHIYCPSILP